MVVALWYIRRIGLPLWTTCDVFAPGIALGHVVGRFGCFFAGCCYGKPTDVPWAITFTDPFAATNVGTPLERAAAPDAALRGRRRGADPGRCCWPPNRAGGAFPGRTFWLYMLLYAVSRYVIEIYRGDPRGSRRHASRPRSSSRCCSRRWRWSCWSISDAGRRAPEPKRERGRRREDHVRSHLDVPDDSDGVRLDRFLVSVLAEQSRSQIQRLIKDGHVHVGGRAAKANQPVKAGQQIVTSTCPSRSTRCRSPRRCRCRSSTRTPTSSSSTSRRAWSCIRRRATRAARWSTRCCTTSTISAASAARSGPGIVHRLDRGTSGLMVVAKHDAAHEELARQFHDREVEKEYIGARLGRGAGGPAHRRADRPRSRRTARRCRAARLRRSREAVTRIVRAEHFGRGADAGQRGDSHRPHASDSRAPERDRPSRSSAMRCTAASTGACPATCAPSPISSGRFCTPRGWRSSIRPTAGGWSSRASCRPTCSRCSTN